MNYEATSLEDIALMFEILANGAASEAERYAPGSRTANVDRGRAIAYRDAASILRRTRWKQQPLFTPVKS